MTFVARSVVIVGGGASGFFAAIHAKLTYPDSKVVIIEKSSQVLSKVKVSGGGRCNVTHACFDPKELILSYPRGQKELLGPFYHFGPRQTFEFFESRGVPLKIEPDGRVFPKSNSSSDIIQCLTKTAQELGVLLWTNCEILSFSFQNPGFLLSLSSGQSLFFDAFILATGSSSKGLSFAKQLGHTLIPQVPSLFTFGISDPKLHAISGSVATDVSCFFPFDPKGAKRGPLLITHWGLSGPSVLKLSAFYAKILFEKNYLSPLCVNFFPDFSLEELFTDLKKFQLTHSKKQLSTVSLSSKISLRFFVYLLDTFGLSLSQPWSALPEKKLSQFAFFLQNCPFEISSKGKFKEEFVSAGGVSLKEIQFKTMESKCCSGFFVVGEALDIDGITGGFNFQNAWTSGFLAGTSCFKV